MFKVEIRGRFYTISAEELLKLSCTMAGVNVVDFINLNKGVYSNEIKSR
jgi:hypothetical protein